MAPFCGFRSESLFGGTIGKFNEGADRTSQSNLRGKIQSVRQVGKQAWAGVIAITWFHRKERRQYSAKRKESEINAAGNNAGSGGFTATTIGAR